MNLKLWLNRLITLWIIFGVSLIFSPVIFYQSFYYSFPVNAFFGMASAIIPILFGVAIWFACQYRYDWGGYQLGLALAPIVTFLIIVTSWFGAFVGIGYLYYINTI